MRRVLARGLVVLAAAFTTLVAGVIAFPSVASAHEVTSITANCTEVTVHFSGFPRAGVMVNIAATVEGHGTAATSTMVDSHTSVATLDISSKTSAMSGATADVDVDVTWTFEGPQHVHRTLSVTCGSATTTAPSTTTRGPTRRTAPSTVATGAGGNGKGAGNGSEHAATIAVKGATAVLSPNGAAVAGRSATAPAARTGSLPRTGSGTDALVGIGLGAVATGTALAARRRRLRAS